MNRSERREVESILVDTLSNAAEAPYYRAQWGDRWQRVRTLADLASLPLLDKATAATHQSTLIVGERPPGVGVFSSGTSTRKAHGPRLHVPTTATEHEIRAATAPRGKASKGFHLSVVSVNHGLPNHLAGEGALRVPWLHDANALAMLELTIRTPQPDGRRVNAMVIGAGAVKALTVSLLAQGFRPATFGIRIIGTFSYRLSDHWRALVESTFDATVYDNYSLSEIATPFTSCLACGALHAGHPPVAFELLSLSSSKPVKRGQPGRLVLTTLYPFTSTMPFIRYDTADIAVDLGTCAATGKTSLQILGRQAHGLVAANGDFVLGPIAVRNVLESLPEVEKTLHPMVRLGLLTSPELGPPRWSVAFEKRRAVLRFETRFDPVVYAARARELEHEVLARLAAADPTTRRWLEAGRVEAKAGPVTPLTDRFD